MPAKIAKKTNRRQSGMTDLERFILLENLEYAAKYAPDGFADIASIRRAVIQLLKGVRCAS